MDRLLIAEAAEEEYTESLKWYAERSLRAAERFDAAFEQALNSIAGRPERYPLCDDRHRFYLLKGYPFQIIYRRALRIDGWSSRSLTPAAARAIGGTGRSGDRLPIRTMAATR